MKFEVEVPDDQVEGLRVVIALLQETTPGGVSDEQLISELFYLGPGSYEHGFDIRDEVTVKVIP